MDTEIRMLPSMGRSLFAKNCIKKGAVIFEEDPLVCSQFSWNIVCNYKACNHCLRPLETAEENVKRLSGNNAFEIPFPDCCETKRDCFTICSGCGVEYCSENCRLEALNQYHQVLCVKTFDRNGVHPLEQLDEAWRNMHFPPETSSIFLIVRLLARIVQSDNKDEAIQTMLGFCHKSVNEEAELTHKFMGEKFSNQVNVLREMLINLLPQPEIQQFLTPEGFQSLIALIGTNGQGVGSSPFSRWRQNVEKLNLTPNEREKINKLIDQIYDKMYNHSGDFINSEGVALYLKQSAANHSCEPNAEINFLHNNFRLSLIALKDIEANEEIFISYLNECEVDRSRHSRRKYLMENYLFNCECNKCLEEIDDPDVTSEEEEEMSAEED